MTATLYLSSPSITAFTLDPSTHVQDTSGVCSSSGLSLWPLQQTIPNQVSVNTFKNLDEFSQRTILVASVPNRRNFLILEKLNVFSQLAICMAPVVGS